MKIFDWKNLRLEDRAARTTSASCDKSVQTNGIPLLFENSKLKSRLAVVNKKNKTQRENILNLRKDINKLKSQINRISTESRNLKESIADTTGLDVRLIVVVIV